MTTTVIDIPLGDIKPSPFNHRKIFNGLDELADSIKSKGVLQPITVRPLGKEYELVFGERRYRASKLAKLPTIRGLVVTMSDVEVLEAQLVENLQRADVHPIEEANGFNDLMKKHGYTADQLAAKTGKSKAYVYARLKLCALAPAARDACLEGKLDASVALLIARIPTKDLQDKATKEILGGDEFDTWDLARDNKSAPPPEGLGADDDRRQKRELTVREAMALLHRKYMLRLELATFDPDDKDLVPKAGACTGCVHRSGNQRELFSDVKSADVCTSPACFAEKKEAAWKRLGAKAKESGAKVMSDAETKKAFSQWNGQLEYGSPYIDLAARASYDIAGNANGNKTWEQVFGKEELPPITYARDQQGRVYRLVVRDEAMAKLRKDGKLAKKPSKPKASPQEKAAAASAKAREETRDLAIRIALGKVADRAAGAIAEKKELAFWRFIAGVVAGSYHFASEAVEQRRGEDLEKLAKSLKTTGELRALVVEVLAGDDADHYSGSGKSPHFDAACDLFGVDWKKCQDEAKKQLKNPEPEEAE